MERDFGQSGFRHPQQPRPICLRCLKARVSCLCERMQPFWTQHRFGILMHEKEHRDRLGTGTGRMTALCLQNSFLEVGHIFSDDARVRGEIRRAPRAFLVYPGEGSIDLNVPEERVLFHRLAAHAPALFLVLDASWSCSVKMMRVNPFLQLLPQVSFSMGPSSGFAFRRQPHPHCLSTVESVYEVIKRVEPDPRITAESENLMEVFRELVRFQSRFGEKEPCEPAPVPRSTDAP